MNLAHAADTSTFCSGDDCGVVGDATEGASDGRPLGLSEFCSSLRPGWNQTAGSVGDARSGFGAMIPVLGRVTGLAYSGELDSTSTLSALPALPELRPKIALIHLRSRCASNNSGVPSEGVHRFLWRGLLHPFIASGCNVVKDFSEPLFPIMPVENNAFGGKSSGHGCETERTKGGEDSRESRGHGVLKPRSAECKLGSTG